MSGGGIGLHWDDIDDDISVPALLKGSLVKLKPRSRKKSRTA